MDETIWKLSGECSYFVGNVLVQVRHIFLPVNPWVLSLLKLRSVGGILEHTKKKKKKKIQSKQVQPLK